MRFHLPVVTGKPPSTIARALLTPPAAIADAAVDAVVIVTAPVWFTILLSTWKGDLGVGGHERGGAL